MPNPRQHCKYLQWYQEADFGFKYFIYNVLCLNYKVAEFPSKFLNLLVENYMRCYATVCSVLDFNNLPILLEGHPKSG